MSSGECRFGGGLCALYATRSCSCAHIEALRRAAPAEAPRCECTGARIGYVAPRDGPIECGQCKACRDYYASQPPPASVAAAPAEAPLADEAARLRAWIDTPAATITITQGNETRSLERDCADAAARIESDAARIREHEALLGKIAMAAMQEAWDDVRDLTRDLKVTFPDGSPHVSLAAPDSAAEQGEAK